MAWVRLLVFVFLIGFVSGCGSSRDAKVSAGDVSSLTVWHTYSAGSEEERVFEETVDRFRLANTDLSVEVVRVPFSQTVMQFITASQGGEAPDLIRVADSHLTQIGGVTVNGVPLLEDLRAHLTPAQASRFLPSTIKAMRMDNALLALPVSQSTMSLLYNPALFEQYGIAPPNADWTIDDFIETAQAFRGTGVDGISIPLRWTLWVMPFMSAYGGDLFDGEDAPRFAAPGMAEALDFARALEFELELVNSANQIDASKTKFSRGRAAMIIEGVWNIPDYHEAGIEVSQSLLPTHPETGLRMRPLNTIIGWGISTQSVNKPAAFELALWLSEDDAQQAFLERTLTLPSSTAVTNIALQSDDELVAGFVEQAEYSFSMPTKRGVQQIFLVIDTAIELVTGTDQDAQLTLEQAEEEMRAILRQ